MLNEYVRNGTEKDKMLNEYVRNGTEKDKMLNEHVRNGTEKDKNSKIITFYLLNNEKLAIFAPQ